MANSTITTHTPKPHALSRSSDPETSKLAAYTLKREGHLQALLAAYTHAPLTSEEAAHIAGIDPWQASKRTSDLIKAGLIHELLEGDEPLKRRGSSGRWQRVLTATPKT